MIVPSAASCFRCGAMSGREPRAEEKAQCFLILKFRHVEAEQLSFAENMIGCHDHRFCFPNAPVGPRSRKLPRGRDGLVMPSWPRQMAEMMRGSLAASALALFLSAGRLPVRRILMSRRRVGRCIENLKSS